MALSALISLNTGPNRTGTGSLYELCDTARYRQVMFSDLVNDGLAFDVSSAQLSSGKGGCAAVLFSSLVPLGSYDGRFVQISASEGSSFTDGNLSAQAFDNATMSLLLIGTNRGTETRVSFRTLFLGDWNSYLVSALAGTDAVVNGDPLLTWTMFPAPSSVPLDPDLTYLRVAQPLVVSVHVGPLITYHYDAGIGYYIFLYVDASQHLKAFVAGYDVYVAGGFYHDDIVNALTPQVAAGVAKLDGMIAGKLAPLSGVALRDVYYLPSDQSSPVPSVFTGSTDDVTIVVEHA